MLVDTSQPPWAHSPYPEPFGPSTKPIVGQKLLALAETLPAILAFEVSAMPLVALKDIAQVLHRLQ